MTVATALAGTAAVLAVLLLLINRAEWWRGFLAATLVSVLAAAASAPLLGWGLRRRLGEAVAAYFLATGARLIVSLGGSLLAVLAGGYPPLPTLLLMVVFYFALLAVETTMVSRAIWSAKA